MLRCARVLAHVGATSARHVTADEARAARRDLRRRERLRLWVAQEAAREADEEAAEAAERAGLEAEALAEMHRREITCLFVTETEAPAAPVGLVHLHDCLRAGVSEAGGGHGAL